MRRGLLACRTALLGGAGLAALVGTSLLSIGEGHLPCIAAAEARGGGGGHGGGHGGGNGGGPGGHGFGGGPGDRGGFGGGWGGGWGGRGGDRDTGGRGEVGGSGTPTGGTPTAPADVTEPASTTVSAPAGNGDAADRQRLFELLGAQPEAEPPRIDATPAGPDLTHQEERALIAKGWRGTR